MRVKVESKNSYHLINHGPCNLITTGDEKQMNVAAINWTMPLNNDPPLMITVVEEGIFTNELIQKSQEFVINLMGESSAEKVLACGRFHGNEVNKFEKFGLTPLSGKEVKTPHLKESLAHIECRIIACHPYEGVNLYVGKVLYAEVEESVWDGKALILEKVKSIHHMTGGTFAVSERTLTIKKPAS